jgi:peptidoglycan/LPS O-acetylase OafA/YrhL
MSTTLRYRPALDGVRAIAVLAVIVYHLNTHLPGGFLGVDVFFVLSGYLITTLLLRELAATGSVRLSQFWARRARRLLPAVLLLLAVVAIVVARSAPLSTLAARRDDMLSTLLYVANWHFIASDQSYFTIYTGASPLRHMWSLAIEEQFYLLWPLLLLGAWRLFGGSRRLLLWLIGAGIAVSTLAMVLR